MITLQRVVLPIHFRLRSDPKWMQRAYLAVTKLCALFAAPTFLGMAIVAPELVPADFGPQWEPSIPLMQLLALAGIVRALGAFNGEFTLGAGRPGLSLILTGATLVAMTGALVLTYPDRNQYRRQEPVRQGLVFRCPPARVKTVDSASTRCSFSPVR